MQVRSSVNMMLHDGIFYLFDILMI